ncbi:hypothetical protein NRK68_36435 (plasmid) [Streptomyces yangpuensis]|uniref:Uncharacterized protein n=1 Tax=Streptomyces yangpuensis TaxID=1648182 RepID=A0ABY5QAU2_9ACTN|nr:hypothetical protein [Streptomyces yangpuensis]UUY52745.1 hypothetical protein NRK68_36435 [Streptomyces yangpuensis]
MSSSDKATSAPAAAGSAGRVPAGEYVATARRLAEISADLQRLSVIAERIRGVPWEAIGQAHGGLSRAAVHNRYAQTVKAWEEEHPGAPDEQFTVVDVQLQGAYAEIDLLLERQRELSRLSHVTASVAERPTTEPTALYEHIYRLRDGDRQSRDHDVASRLARESRQQGREDTTEDPLDRANLARLLRESGHISAVTGQPLTGNESWVRGQHRPPLLPQGRRAPGLEARVAALEEAVERLMAERERDSIT